MLNIHLINKQMKTVKLLAYDKKTEIALENDTLNPFLFNYIGLSFFFWFLVIRTNQIYLIRKRR